MPLLNRSIFFLLCMTYYGIVNGQRSYSEAMRMGDSMLFSKDYGKAINFYFAAEAFDPVKKDSVNEAVQKVFTLINSLKDEAISNKELAERQRIEADKLRALADSKNLAHEAQLLQNEKWLDSAGNKVKLAYIQNRDNKGPQQNADIFNALHAYWMAKISDNNQMREHTFPVRSLCYKSNTKTVYSADEGGQLMESNMTSTGWTSSTSQNFKEPVRCIEVSPDETKLLVLTIGGHGHLMDLNLSSGKMKKMNSFNFKGLPVRIIFNENNKFLILTTEGISVYSIGSDLNLDGPVFNQDHIADFLLTKDNHLYIASGRTIQCYASWNEVLAKKATETIPLNSTITKMSMDRNERYLAVGTDDGYIWVKDLVNGNKKFRKLQLSKVSDLKFTELKNQRLQLASANADHTIKLIDVASYLSTGDDKEDIITLQGHTKWIYGLTYSSDAEWLFSCGEDNKIIAWKPLMDDLFNTLFKN